SPLARSSSRGRPSPPATTSPASPRRTAASWARSSPSGCGATPTPTRSSPPSTATPGSEARPLARDGLGEELRDEGRRGEAREVVDPLARADELHRDPGALLHEEHETALRRAVELRED